MVEHRAPDRARPLARELGRYFPGARFDSRKRLQRETGSGRRLARPSSDRSLAASLPYRDERNLPHCRQSGPITAPVRDNISRTVAMASVAICSQWEALTRQRSAEARRSIITHTLHCEDPRRPDSQWQARVVDILARLTCNDSPALRPRLSFPLTAIRNSGNRNKPFAAVDPFPDCLWPNAD